MKFSQQRISKFLKQLLRLIFNNLLIKDWNGYSATIRQGEVKTLCLEKGFDMKEIYDNKWLDIEPIFMEIGWSVD